MERKEKEIKEKDMIINILQQKYKTFDDEDEYSDDSKGYNSDANSTFDYAQLDLSDTDVVQKVKENNTKTKENAMKCQQCDYKCKHENTFRKHMNTMHGAKRL